MFDIFIKRPVLSSVISILIVILGVIGIKTLSLELYPDIAPPTVKVTANYTGANAETVLKSVITPLEEAINGVEGMTYITSTAANDGSATINVFFDLSINPDIAAVNVQNRVAKANSLLPALVIQSGITVAKSQNSVLLFATLYSENPDYDDIFVQNFAKINLVPKMQRILGVGDVQILGGGDYSMRIWLDPQKMANFQIMPSDIQQALREQNVEAPIGKFGENAKGIFEYTIRYKGTLNQIKEYENIIIKSLGGGKYLRLRDVAEIELGGYSYSSKNLGMGFPGAIFGFYQTPGSNSNEIIAKIYQTLEEEKKTFPQGIKYVVPYNTKDFLDASIDEVIKTLIEAFILVFLVVLIFLQNVRATLIPIISVPVSVIGTFFFLKILGYSVNMLTLFALVLSIGIVVDDAIVVVEAVHGKLEEGYKSSREAALSAMGEISGAIISITLVLIAVFVPVMFIGGSSGKFYQQFAVTLTIAILISALNALTLTPALSAVFLKPHTDEKNKKKNLVNKFCAVFNIAFTTITNKYIRVVRFLSYKKWIVVATLVIACVVIFFSFKTTPTGFIPNEDVGRVFVDISLAPGSALYQTEAITKQVDSVIKTEDMVVETSDILGRSILNNVGGPSYAFLVLKFKEWAERKQPNQHSDSIIEHLKKKMNNIRNARIVVFTPPTVRGFGNAAGFEFSLLNKNDDSWAKMDQVYKTFTKALQNRPEIAYTATSFNAAFPQYEVKVNLEKIKDAGLSLTDIFNTLQGYYAGLYTTDFNRFGKQYRVLIQAKPSDRLDRASLNNVFVTNKNKQSVAISEFITVERVFAPEVVTRYNLFKSMNITGKVNPGYSTGDGIRVIQEEAIKNLPSSYGYEFTGLSREELISSGQSTGIFLLSLIFVYFLLAALYESYILPLAVLTSLVIGIMGAILFVKYTGLENNIYFQVSLIMLLGLLAKNAILIVEFALLKRHHGLSLYEAAAQGAKVRLRPILMTTFAFALGIMPLAFARGVGAVGNKSIGMGALGGSLVGTLLGVFVIPILFVIFQGMHEKCFGIYEEKEHKK